MSTRRAKKPLTGPRTDSMTILLGEGEDGARVASLRPPSFVRSGVSNFDDAEALRDLIYELQRAATYLAEGDA